MDPLLPPPSQFSQPPSDSMEPPPSSAASARIANPTPVILPSHNHPPYSEMITAAILALNEREGSSRQAIAKYIERAYPELPPTHSTLLTQHLKRLKNSGELVMVKHSYKLPRSPPPAQSQQPMELAGNVDPAPGTKRKPGRPPKPKPESQQLVDVQPELQGELQFQPPQFQFPPQQQGQFQFQPDPVNHQFQFQHPSQLQFQPQFEIHGVQPFVVQDTQNNAGMGHESVFASLGLVDGPVAPPQDAQPPAGDSQVAKRRPGRPKKADSGNKDPANPLGVRRPGRPPKNGMTAEPGVVGRPRGRPPKRVVSAGTGRPRGRPKASAATIAQRLGRPRGRPPKKAQISGAAGELAISVPITDSEAAGAQVAGNAPVDGASNGVVPMPRRRGRPPRLSKPPGWSSKVPKPRGRPPRSIVGGVRKPRKLSGRPVGRPRKNAVANAPDPQETAAIQDLQGKLEHFKFKIKETANVLRPCINNESAMAALQDLEALAGANDVDVNPVEQQPVV